MPTLSSCTILLNQKAGALHNTPSSDQIRELAHEIGLDAEVLTTRSAKHMRSILRRLVADGCKKVAVVGGDGTVALAVQDVAHSNTALAIIPQGTFNNFATALHIPMDLPSALRVLKDGVVREIDLGKIRDRYFTEAAGVGLFADALSIYGDNSVKNLFRVLVSVGRIVSSYRPHGIRLVVDGKPLVERAVLCAVANTYRTGSAVPIAPEAKVTDGQLDVVIVGDLKRSELLPYFRALRNKRHLNLPKVTTLRAREVCIEARHRMLVHADDRIIGKTPVTITAEPKAIKVLVERL
ncbi:MAG: diacylglycerol kinase family lipid kinase [Chloroflexi bacterium]|nr:diacylglycerol kinase family lipid kinase [Chloroflexota bacterium]